MLKEYKEFKNILSGCRSIIDANRFLELYIEKNHLSDETKILLYSMFKGKDYENIIEMNIIKTNLIRIKYDIIKNKDENYLNIYSDFFKGDNNNFDLIQKNSFRRLFNSFGITLKENKKTCPHCGYSKYMGFNKGGKYMICGYDISKFSNTGFNWKGCGKDWCLVCNKKLCKSWHKDELYIEENRKHNGECCKKYAQKNNLFENEFCSCND